MSEIKSLTPEQIRQLQAPLPAEAIKQHPTKTYLSSIKAIYVVERLNQVFGIGSWHLRSEIVDNKSVMIVVKSTLTIPSYGIELESYGGNDNGGENSKNFDLGDAYKGATTDALTKICSYLEIGIAVFKGSKNPAPKDQPKVNGTSSYNHTTIGDLSKPLISNSQFKSLVERVTKGDYEAADKAKAAFSFAPKQLDVIESLLKQPA